jgi:hypothetical protein
MSYKSKENNILEKLRTTLEQPGTTFKIVFFAKVGANLTHSRLTAIIIVL